ncbi:MAG: sigma-70 family RNA polymerase sigma factor [Candidatus Latescibacterota bacterium]|jgi:RNA polymerase sigma factor (sigma-70 family)
MDPATDAQLVQQALQGQADAFALLVRRYQAHAYGVAVGLLSDFHLAQDVVQEALVAAYRDLGRLRQPERFGSWLHGIVRHTAGRARRQLEQARRLQAQLAVTGDLRTEPSRPDADLEAEERRRLVEQALAQLSEASREAVGLYYADGLSYAEMARFLNVSEAAVLGRLQRARARLREELEVVKEAFAHEDLPPDFAAEIRRLLQTVVAHQSHQGDVVRQLVEIGVPAVPELTQFLEAANLAVRTVAAQALCSIGDRRALSPILRLLYADQPWWSWRLFVSGKVLGIPGVREALLDAIRQTGQAQTPRERVTPSMAIQAVSHLEGDAEVMRLVEQVYRDPSVHANVQLEAFAALWRLRPEARLELATEGLQHPVDRHRRMAAWLAWHDGVQPPVDACLKAFGRNTAWWGRRFAAELVLRHGEEGRRALEQLLASGSPDERSTAALALARFGSMAALGTLKEELLGLRGGRKWANAVSGALAGRYGSEVAQWLTTMPAGTVELNRLLWTLARSRADAGSTIEGFFADGPPAARAAATRILARQQGAALLPRLRECLAAGRPRKVAQEAFWQVHRLREDARPMVEEMRRSPLWTERRAAVSLLRRWGELTPPQRAEAEADPHVAVQHAARWKPVRGV